MSNKTRKIFATVLAIVLVIAMVIPLCLSYIK